ncbi:MAG: glycerol-3-phosphate dehydrogenase/oxidase [Actinobacteria bacterium]|nr:glycerol-3-phosphate dehydrogenase/oxidase [Actinomycetota bacterium]
MNQRRQSRRAGGPPRAGTASRLGPRQRARDVERLRTESFDLVVIGGGVTGVGAALDAAARGLSVALVEARDWASGTSSRSSKLIHGGLRYLEQLDFPLVREALKERGLLMGTIAPHLVRPVPFLLPLRHWWQRPYYGAGIALYDLLASAPGIARGVPVHRHLFRADALRLMPGLRPDVLTGAIQYYDAHVDDARHTMFTARTAATYGAALLTSMRAIGLLRDGDRVTGVRVRDLETGEEIPVSGGAVVAATGVWSDDIGAMVGGRSGLRVRASKGVHLVVPRDRIDGESGLILRTGTSVLFVVPSYEHWIIGTTDTDWNLDRAHPAASSTDIDYLLEQVNQVLVRPLRPDDIEGVYAGLRPLLAGEDEASSLLSREHAVVQPLPGLILVAGGKYTTYRVMARDAVDAAVPSAPRSRTHQIALVGAEGYHVALANRDWTAALGGLTPTQVEHLLVRYGALIAELVALVVWRPELARTLPGAPETLRAEVYYAASAEGALHLVDVLTRRTRISIETWDRGLAAAEPAAELMGEVLGWDAATRANEVAHYQARIAAERESQRQPDDRTADAARMGAPDVRTGGV